ncbi:MAG: hypothetical protein K2K23_03530 [Muribaculaceae bacterium]|nr:hypothetical protein [Muribaculaceae bacterium]
MKRFLTMIVAVCAFFAASAQNPMVTLSHNGELSFFTNLTALESAYSAAEHGDTIYLSQGDFVVNGGSFKISKDISIVGNGYGSHILGDITVNISKQYVVGDAPLFDGVRLDKLTFSAMGTSTPETAEIRRCWIRNLDDGACAANNMTFDKCYIGSADFFGGGTVFLKNSKVSCSSSNTLLNHTTAINCNINVTDYYPLTAISCILQKGGSSNPSVNGSSASIINCLLDFKPSSSSLYEHECYYIEDASESILDDKMNCTLNLTESGYLGQDGTVVGIQGGEYPFSENPSVPTVDTANSSVEYDSSANKLKVNITVKAD